MQLCRIVAEDGSSTWAVQRDGATRALGAHEDLGTLLARGREAFVARLEAADGPPLTGRLAAPLDRDTEVWAAGVTYEVSREAREAESEASADVYRRVYDADRPELFFKANGWRVSGPGEPIGIRRDSTWDAPEPELALVVAADAEIVGYTICNDVSSRSIEGANPLYLPQAKMYRGSCAVGPVIVPAPYLPHPEDLDLGVVIERGGQQLWTARTSTSRLHRTYAELVSWLFRAERFPRGVVLSTGTSLVPPEELTLAEGDVVTVSLEGVGELSNPVIQVGHGPPAQTAPPG